MHQLVLLLGSNLGDRIQFLALAREQVQSTIGDITCTSKIYESTAWGVEDQQNFYNQVIRVSTNHTPEECLKLTNNIEKEAKRQRNEKWGARTLDIDLLFYNDEIINLPHLSIPHPYLHKRRFTLKPLEDCLPKFIHPEFKKNMGELLDICEDNGRVWPLANEL